MKVRDAAAYLAISERKLWQLSDDRIIPTVRIGRAVRYDSRDLDTFISKAKDGHNEGFGGAENEKSGQGYIG